MPIAYIWRPHIFLHYMADFIIEVAAFTLESALLAQKAGADRVEFCNDPFGGGTTPSTGQLKVARKMLKLQLFPIIRPRGGHFVYTDAEFEAMKTDIQLCRAIGCDGVVMGMLTPDGQVDTERCAELVTHAGNMSLTFHRAFDRCIDPAKALEDIIELGFDRILTSGQALTAMEGATTIWDLTKQADERISLMPGGGVRTENLAALVKATAAWEFHTSVRMDKVDKKIKQGGQLPDDPGNVTIDDKELKEMRKLLEKLFK